jgi:hypothetical protein
VYSGVGGDEFMIRGSKNPLKEADINPLTSDRLSKIDMDFLVATQQLKK